MQRSLFLVFFLCGILGAQAQNTTTVEEVYQILQQKCLSCHSGGAPAGSLDFTGTGNTNLAKAISVANKLVNKDPINAAAKAKKNKLVVQGRPDQSFLFRKINGDFDTWYDALAPAEGALMPNQSTSLTKIEKEMIRQWIIYGAPNTGVVVDKALITQFYDVYGIKAFPDGPPAKPAAIEGFQMRTGPFFLPPGGENEYYIKHKLDLPAATEVNRLDIQFPLYSHHYIIYNFETATSANAIPNGLRVNSFHNDINLVAAVQEKTDLKLPPSTAFKWEKDRILDLNTHYINYSLDHPLQADVFTNVYTQDIGTADQEMFARLIAHFNFVIPNNGNPYSSTAAVTNPGADSIYLWGVVGHTHKYGAGYKVWERTPQGTKGPLIYDASCGQGLPGCPSPFFDYQHIPMRYFEPLRPINWSQGIIHEATWINDGPIPLGFGPTSADEMMVMIAFYTLNPLTSDASEPASGHDTETLVLAPNPAEAWVSLKYTHGKAIGSVQVIDMMGRIVLEEHNITASQHTLQTASLPMGVYQLRTNAAVTKLVIKG